MSNSEDLPDPDLKIILLTMNEKATFLEEAAEKKHILFFEHDSVNECCTLKQTEKGVRLEEVFSFESI